MKIEVLGLEARLGGGPEGDCPTSRALTSRHHRTLLFRGWLFSQRELRPLGRYRRQAECGFHAFWLRESFVQEVPVLLRYAAGPQ